MPSFFHAGMKACEHEFTYGLIGFEGGAFDRLGGIGLDADLQRNRGSSQGPLALKPLTAPLCAAFWKASG
jgi:hypothetical protein